MPPRKQPATLFDISLPVTALRIRNHCDAILRNYDDVTSPAFKDRIESFNEQLRKEVPKVILDRIRQHHDLAVFIYFNVTTLEVQDTTLRDTQKYQHLTLNVFPRLERVTLLDLSEVEGTIDLFRAISLNCPELQSIVINMDLSEEQEEVGTCLLLLTECKKLQVIRNTCCVFYCSYGNDTLKLHNSVAVRMLQELPELQVFLCDIASILAKKEMLPGVYNITQLACRANSDLMTAENVQWLNIHCPFINNVMMISMKDTILQTLALTDWRIKSLVFFGIEHTFSEAMKLFLKIKGTYIEDLVIHYVSCNEGESLCYDNVVWISQCCPVLNYLKFDGYWYNDGAPTPLQTTPTCLFPNLEHFSVKLSKNTAFIPMILEALINLKVLECVVFHHAVSPFLNTLAGLRNSFTHLTGVLMWVYYGTTETTTAYKQRFLPIAMGWQNIRQIDLFFNDPTLLVVEPVQCVTEIESMIKEKNLDVKLRVITSTMFPPAWLEHSDSSDGSDVDEQAELYLE